MLTYDLDPDSRYPLYQQIYNKIKDDIVQGKIKSGEKLPSKRSLAKHLQLSVITVENAYAQLNAEGYIYAVEKKGYFTTDIVKLTSIISSTTRKSRIKIEKKEYVADFVSNTIDTQGFPITIWSRLVREVLAKDTKTGMLQSTPLEGLYELREAIGEHLYHYRGLDVSEKNIIIGSGTEYLYNLLIQLLHKESIFAVEDPGYPKPYLIYKSNRALCTHIPMDSQGMRMKELYDSNANIIHITPSHHFPTGIVMPVGRRYELLNWAYEKSGRYIIEDDYDSEFRMSGKPIPSLLSIDKRGKVIYMNTFSKTIAPSVRISYMILPDRLMEIFKQELGFYSNTVPALEQKVLSLFMSRGYFEKHINRMKTIYRIKRDAIIGFIKASTLNKICEILEEDSGLHFLLKINTILTDEQVIREAEQLGIKISSVSEYSYLKQDIISHLFIINYPGVELQDAKFAIRMLEGIFLD